MVLISFDYSRPNGNRTKLNPLTKIPDNLPGVGRQVRRA
jgi:hypothetical protein